MEKVQAFIEDCRQRGYQISGSVFKVDFNGRLFTVGFWVRPTDYDSTLEEYRLPGRIGKAKHEDFDTAVDLAIQEATQGEE